MKNMVFCKTTERGIHSFYLETAGETYFLFSQGYRKGVQNYYGEGVRLDDAFNYGKSRGDTAITRTMKKIPMYIKHIEKEYGIEVLEQTKKKNANSNSYRCDIARCA